MGLIKAAVSAVSGVLSDQWLEYFSCDAMGADTLVVKGEKTTSRRSSNRKGNDNIISDGSGIVVADGQCMLIVEQGEVIEVCAEPGQYTYNNATEPSIFKGDLGDGIELALRNIGRRFTHGGDAAGDQRVYYVNTKEIMDNKFGTANPFMFRVVDSRIGLDKDVSIRCNGIYSYKITNPVTFYMEVCGNVSDRFERRDIDMQLKTEFISALQPAFAKLSALELRPSQIPAHATELEDAMNETLTKKWKEKRGISVVSVALNPITLKDEDMKKIQQFQDSAVLRDPSMAAATLAGAQADAMRTAAGNKGGAAMGFMNMNMAAQGGGLNAQTLYQMGQQTQPAADSWRCSCGAQNTGKFCTNCGNPKPQSGGWICSCGTHNTGNFCTNCGSKKPEASGPRFCSNCGWKPSDPARLPKFCPQCGAKFE